MDHEDELTKKIEEQFYGGRDEQIVFKHMETADNCLTAFK